MTTEARSAHYAAARRALDARVLVDSCEVRLFGNYGVDPDGNETIEPVAIVEARDARGDRWTLDTSNVKVAGRPIADVIREDDEEGWKATEKLRALAEKIQHAGSIDPALWTRRA